MQGKMDNTNSGIYHFIKEKNLEVFAAVKQAGHNTRARCTRASHLRLSPFRACPKFCFFKLFLARMGFQQEAEERLLAPGPSPRWYTCQGRPAWHCQITQESTQIQSLRWVPVILPQLLVFQAGQVVSSLCSAAAWQISFPSTHSHLIQVIKLSMNEMKTSTLTLERHHRFRLEPENLPLSQIPFITERFSHQHDNNAIRTPFFMGEVKIRTETCDTGWVGRVFSSYRWSH